MYKVRKSWGTDMKNQIGAYKDLNIAKKEADKNKGYFVFNEDGIAIYPLPYMIKVTKSLKIFNASSNDKQTGSTGAGSFTITKVEKNRGYLKSSTKTEPKWVALKDVPLVYITEEDKKKETVVVKKKTYLEKVGEGADKTYAEVIKCGCQHKGTPNTNKFSLIAKNRTITCNRAMSISLQLGECLPEGKLVCHTSPCGKNGSELLKKKNTIDKCMSGYKNLIPGTCEIYKAGCNFDKLPDKYKAKGNCYIYDSDAAVSAGQVSVKDAKTGEVIKVWKIYTCNESKDKQVKQDSKGIYRYVMNCVDSGYVFKHTILYVVSPKK